MKYLKLFENNMPDVNDFVFIEVDQDSKKQYVAGSDVHIIDGKIGEIISVQHHLDVSKVYSVLIDNEEYEIYSGEILYFGKTKEELEMIIQTNKYNI